MIAITIPITNSQNLNMIIDEEEQTRNNKREIKE